MEITKEKAEKVLSVVNAGLVSGLGEAKPGHMCVEAAVCYAFDLPHNDRPMCVGEAVRAFMIRLNDAAWPTPESRTEGLRKLSIAQLGSDSIDQNAFRQHVVVGVISKVIPIALRASGKLNPDFAGELERHAVACEAVTDMAQGQAVVEAAREVALKARKAAYASAAYAAASAAYAVAAAAADAADAADAAAYSAAADAAVAYAADAAAYAASAASAAAADAADAAADARLNVLQTTAQIGLDALIACKSPGVEFLDLCE